MESQILKAYLNKWAFFMRKSTSSRYNSKQTQKCFIYLVAKNNIELYLYSKYLNLFILLICVPLFSVFCFYSAFTWFNQNILFCYLLTAIAVLGILLSMYYLCFLRLLANHVQSKRYKLSKKYRVSTLY